MWYSIQGTQLLPWRHRSTSAFSRGVKSLIAFAFPFWCYGLALLGNVLCVYCNAHQRTADK